MEDLRLEHSPETRVGFAEISVLPEAAHPLAEALETRGWTLMEAGDDETTVVVAVDGPAGSGKSSVSKAASRALGYAYLDTGAAYRALTWVALENGVDTADADEVVALLDDFPYATELGDEGTIVRVGDIDVTHEIREPRDQRRRQRHRPHPGGADRAQRRVPAADPRAPKRRASWSKAATSRRSSPPMPRSASC